MCKMMMNLNENVVFNGKMGVNLLHIHTYADSKSTKSKIQHGMNSLPSSYDI